MPVERVWQEEDIGKEFLLWLYNRAFDGGTKFDLKKSGTVELWFDDRMIFEVTEGEGLDRKPLKVALTGETDSLAQESKAAIKAGKDLVEARLWLSAQELNWNFILKSSLEMTSMKLPPVMTKDKTIQTSERATLVEHVSGIMEEIYNGFLGERAKASDAKLV